MVSPKAEDAERGLGAGAILPWPRPLMQPGGRPNAFHLFCFAPGPLTPGVPMSAARFGLPSPDAGRFCEVRQLPRSLDLGWFDGFRQGSLRGIAEVALGDLKALDAATEATVIITSRPDAPELSHLQAAWAIAKWTVASAIHTRGLAKFGRPDLVTLDVPASRWDAVAGLLRVLAMRLVHGVVLRPGDSTPIDGGVAHFSAYAPDRLHLNNEALLVTGSSATSAGTST